MQADPSSNNFKRRKYWINPRFQSLCIAVISVVSVICTTILYFANYYFFFRFRQMGADFGMSPDHVFFKFLDDQKDTMDEIFLGTALFALFITVFVGMVFSHRIAGPLYRLRNHMSDIGEGKPLTELRFRPKDFFQDLPDAFNKMIRSLQSGGARGYSVQGSDNEHQTTPHGNPRS